MTNVSQWCMKCRSRSKYTLEDKQNAIYYTKFESMILTATTAAEKHI